MVKKHSPAPWVAGHMVDKAHSCNCRFITNASRMGSICEISVHNVIDNVSEGGNDCPPLEEAIANAHLISAAPDLLESLEEILDEYTTLLFDNAPTDNMSDAERYVNENSIVIKAKQAIKKAKGEQ